VAARTTTAVLLAGALVLSGCTQAAPKAGGSSSVRVRASAPPAKRASPTRSASRSAAPKGPPSLGGRCEDLLPVGTVNIALRRTVIGKTAFVLGVAEPDIGRLTYLNCRYGLGAPAKGKPVPAPLVEIGISLYNSPAQAAKRVQGTVDDFLAHGARGRAARVGSSAGTALTGYGNPTVVVAAGPRTVAVSVSPKLLAAGSVAELASLAKAAVDATAHYTPAAPAPTTTR